jgi:hypothetical protein
MHRQVPVAGTACLWRKSGVSRLASKRAYDRRWRAIFVCLVVAGIQVKYTACKRQERARGQLSQSTASTTFAYGPLPVPPLHPRHPAIREDQQAKTCITQVTRAAVKEVGAGSEAARPGNPYRGLMHSTVKIGSGDTFDPFQL